MNKEAGMITNLTELEAFLVSVESGGLGLTHVDRVAEMLKSLADWESDTKMPFFRTDVFWTKFNRDHYDRTYQLTQPESGR